MKNRAVLVLFTFLFASVVSASAQTVRDRLENEPSFKLYSVIFGVTAASNVPVPAIRAAKVIDVKSGTIDAVKVDVPEEYITAAKKKIEANRYEPQLKDGKPVEIFTYFFYVPSHPKVVVVDLDSPLDKQP